MAPPILRGTMPIVGANGGLALSPPRGPDTADCGSEGDEPSGNTLNSHVEPA